MLRKDIRGAIIRGHFRLPVAFYRTEIGQCLAMKWPKMSRNPAHASRPGVKGAPLLENLRYLDLSRFEMRQHTFVRNMLFTFGMSVLLSGLDQNSY